MPVRKDAGTTGPHQKLKKKEKPWDSVFLAASPILVRQQLVHRQQLDNQRTPLEERVATPISGGTPPQTPGVLFFKQEPRCLPDLAIPPMLHASVEHLLPNPIPGGLDLLGNGHIFHVYLPGTSPELATIGLQWRPWRN